MAIDEQKDFHFGKTFSEAFAEWKAAKEKEAGGALSDTTLVAGFADWLDTTKFLTPQLQVLAMLQSRKIDGEVIAGLIDVCGMEKASPVIRGIHARYIVRPRNETQ